jgi:hypothetical protein
VTAWDALDELLELSYGDAFWYLDVAVLLDDRERCRRMLEPFAAVERYLRVRP